MFEVFGYNFFGHSLKHQVPGGHRAIRNFVPETTRKLCYGYVTLRLRPKTIIERKKQVVTLKKTATTRCRNAMTRSELLMQSHREIKMQIFLFGHLKPN